MSGGPSTYVKAFVGGVTSAGAAAVAGLADGSFTTGETITTIVAFFVGFGAVYQLPNKADADPTTSTSDLRYEQTGGYASPATPVGTLPQVPAGPAPGATFVSDHFDAALQSPEIGAPDGSTEVR